MAEENPFELEPRPLPPNPQWGMASLVGQDPNAQWSPEPAGEGLAPLANPSGAEGSFFTIDPAILANMWKPQEPEPPPTQPPPMF
jgi:hypothetical protein